MTDSITDPATETRRTALGTLLVEREYLDQAQLDDALRIGEETGERLGEVIVRLGWVSEDDLAKVLAEQWHLRYFERSAISFDGRALRRMTREDAARLEALPIQEGDDGVVVVALAEPTEARLDALRTLLGDRIDFVVVAKTAIETGLRSELLTRESNGSGNGSGDDSAGDVGQFQRADAEPQAEAVVAESTEAPAPEWGWDPATAEATSTVAPYVPSGEKTAPAFEEIAAEITASVTSQIASLRSLVTDADAKREHAEQEAARFNGELGQAQGVIGQLQGDVGRLESDVARLQGDVARLEGELATREEELTSRTETLRTMQQTLREYADTLDAQS
jgi:Type II secretion system (T2SS), protein E, N-terminal domain